MIRFIFTLFAAIFVAMPAVAGPATVTLDHTYEVAAAARSGGKALERRFWWLERRVKALEAGSAPAGPSVVSDAGEKGGDAALRAEIESWKQDYEKWRADLDAWRIQVSKILSSRGDLGARVDFDLSSIRERLAEHQKRIGQLKGQLDALRHQVRGLQSRVWYLEPSVSAGLQYLEPRPYRSLRSPVVQAVGIGLHLGSENSSFGWQVGGTYSVGSGFHYGATVGGSLYWRVGAFAFGGGASTVYQAFGTTVGVFPGGTMVGDLKGLRVHGLVRVSGGPVALSVEPWAMIGSGYAGKNFVLPPSGGLNLRLGAPIKIGAK